MHNTDQLIATMKEIGLGEEDSRVIADCIITRNSCSWVNTDNIEEGTLKELHHFIQENNYKIRVLVHPVPTRNKFIWEVKVE